MKRGRMSISQGWGTLWRCGVLLAWILLGASPAGSAPRLSPDQAVFLLEYVGSDYELAVRDGEVINAFEYAEVLNFSELLKADFRRVRPEETGRVPTLLATLANQIVTKDASPNVRATVQELLPLLAESLGASPPPEGPADIGRGRHVYQAQCASCHGAEGGGDGPAAVGLEPPATSFLEPRAQLLSLRQIVGATRFGIDGTAMAAYEGSLDRTDIDAVAFYVASLIHKARLAASSAAGTEKSEAASVPPGTTSPATASTLEQAFVGVAQRLSPAVVGITALVEDPDAPPASAGRQTRHGGWQRSQSARVRHPGFTPIRTGSGFFVRPDGTLLTARHVLLHPETGELADRIEVELQDDQRFRAWVVGQEPMIDLAVLRIDVPREVPFLSFGDSDLAAVGQWIIALGDPPGIDRAFVVGTLSATPRRECYQEEPAETLFQTSAWVEPGVFGGPVVDLEGRVLGIAQPRPGYSPPPHVPSALRILPIQLAQTIYEALRVEAESISPWLGFSVLELSGELRRRMPVAPRTGVYIDDVFDPSPASRAGIQAGDVLVSVGGRPLLSVFDFQRELYLAGVGREVALSIHRNGERIEMRVPIEQRPEHLLP